MMSFVWLFVSIAQGEVHVWRNNIAKQKIAKDYSSFRSFWICKTHIKVYQAHLFGWSLFRGHGMPQEDTLRICTIQYQRIVFADQGEESHRDPCWARTLKDTKDTSDYLGCQDLPSVSMTSWHCHDLEGLWSATQAKVTDSDRLGRIWGSLKSRVSFSERFHWLTVSNLQHIWFSCKI